MDASKFTQPARTALLEINGQRVEANSPGLPEAVALAYRQQHRPRCLCRPEGVEMYIARLGDGHVVKRMPQTGSQHAPSCQSFEPAVTASGLEPLLGTAIIEDPNCGATTLRLDFPLSIQPGRPGPPRLASRGGTVRNQGTRLSLRSLLHYLWDQAGLTRWQPGFEGRRHWNTVRRLLLQAAEQKITCGASLPSRLYVPERFSPELKDQIVERRRLMWASAAQRLDRPQHLLLMIAEVKEIVPGRHGYRAVARHIPDLGFAMDEALYHRIEGRFADELALWNASDEIRMVMISAFGLNEAGLPFLAGLYLMTTTPQWVPIEGVTEWQLVSRLVSHQRSFAKLLRYDLRDEKIIPCVALTDAGEPAPLLFADNTGGHEPSRATPSNGASDETATVAGAEQDTPPRGPQPHRS